MDSFRPTRYIIAFIGSVMTILAAVKANFRFHEKWLEYRSTAEILKYQIYLFETESKPYNRENKEELLLGNVYLIIKKENKSWKSTELNNIELLPENK
jgi:hypothetical protein